MATNVKPWAEQAREAREAYFKECERVRLQKIEDEAADFHNKAMEHAKKGESMLPLNILPREEVKKKLEKQGYKFKTDSGMISSSHSMIFYEDSDVETDSEQEQKPAPNPNRNNNRNNRNKKNNYNKQISTSK